MGIHSTVTGIKSNLLLGGYDALKGTVIGLYDLGIGLIDYTGRLINDSRTTITDTRYIINYLKDNRFIIGYEIGRGIANTFEEEVIYGDANSIARYTGKTATEILLAVIGTKGIDKAAKATSAGRTINKVDNVIPSGGMAKTINPNEIRYSQSSVNGAKEITNSMRAKGWAGDPIDVVKMPDGKLTTVDNTRVLSAKNAGIDVQATVHAASDPIPSDMAIRFTSKNGQVPITWGEAVTNRINN